MADQLLYRSQDQVAYLILNREDRRNSLTLEMIQDFHKYLDQIEKDNSIKAVCITGAGDKLFCAGADLAATLSSGDKAELKGPEEYAELIMKMTAFSKPLVAKVNGPCLAGGLGIMLSCDLVYARDDAYFCTPEINVGIFPMMVGALLLRHIGIKKTMDMVLTARKISAREAEAIGLITRSVTREEFDGEIEGILMGLVLKSPIAVKIGKQAFRQAWDMTFDEAVRHLCKALGEVVSTEDAAEGMRAFLEKRKPEFKGC